MNRILACLSFCLLLTLPSCGALAALQQRDAVGGLREEVFAGLSKVEAGVAVVRKEVTEGLDELEKTWTAAHEQADVNKDGKIEGSYEQLLLLLLGGGGLAEAARRKLKNLEGKHEASKADREELKARIEHEREKRKDAQVAALEAQIAAMKKT